MGLPKFGFTYPTVTGENTPKGASFPRILGEFPKMGIWSVYYDGNALPTWREAWFDPKHTGIKWYLISVKTSNLMAIDSCLRLMPEHLRGRVVILLHHEPDQWRSEADPKGDPSPAVWKARQTAFADLRDVSPWKDWIKHAVCFTEDRYRTDSIVWENNWGDTIKVEPRIDFVMFDCFNIGRSIVRTGADIFGKVVAFARREKRRLFIREYGQVTPKDQPTDSTTAAAGVAENWSYAKSQNEIDDIFEGIVWYYNHNNTLADAEKDRRPLTKAVLQKIVEEAAIGSAPTPPTPERTYEEGFQAGRQSRDAEVEQLRESALKAGSLARREAFGEVVAWATGKGSAS